MGFCLGYRDPSAGTSRGIGPGGGEILFPAKLVQKQRSPGHRSRRGGKRSELGNCCRRDVVGDFKERAGMEVHACEQCFSHEEDFCLMFFI